MNLEALPIRFPVRPLDLVAVVVNEGIRAFFRAVCRIDDAQLKRIPAKGPLILLANHVNFLEAPVMATHLQPRPLAALVKVETWKNPILGFLFDLWGGIPIRRGEADFTALRRAEEALAQGKILAVLPEGTRSRDGQLQKGRPGIILIAIRSGAPVLPVAWYGHEKFWDNLRSLKRTDFKVAVGRPFTVHTHGQALSRQVREKILTEMMYQLAAQLPPQYRGVYADLENASQDYLQF